MKRHTKARIVENSGTGKMLHQFMTCSQLQTVRRRQLPLEKKLN